MIFRQELSPGQRLIPRGLSMKVNISRTPVVTALNRLEQEGFLISESFRGFYVKHIDIQELWDLFGVREALDRKKVVLDVESHLQTASMAKNKVLEHLLRINFEHIYLRFALDAVNPNRMPLAVEEHCDIFHVVKIKDLSQSTQAMRLHTRRARNVIVTGISKKME
jgi:DNA-binding GntR family transcriptional regulator